jgi:hypothetical protein
LINIQHIQLIEFGVLFVLIVSRTYSVDRYRSSINRNKYPKHIRVDRNENRISTNYIQMYSC